MCSRGFAASLSPLAILFAACVVCAILSPSGAAKVIGTNVIAQPVTPERIATLPANEQKAWREYLEHSEARKRTDQAIWHKEMADAHVTAPKLAPAGRNAADLPLNNAADWYASGDAVRIATNVVSYQLPDGGWSKNISMAAHPRAPGDRYDTDNLNRFPDPQDFDKPVDENWHYLATLDNDATTTQVIFLAHVTTALLAAHRTAEAEPFRAAVVRGIGYLLESQYPNGGWPQVWPLEGGYHDAITINDDAMLHAIEVLHDAGTRFTEGLDASTGPGNFLFVPPELRKRASDAADRGIALLLQLQIVENGKRTAWAQQYDALTLAPTSARNYEMASISSGESVSIVAFLMQLPKPTTEQINAVFAAAAWFTATEIFGVKYGSGDFRADRANPDGRKLVAAPGAGPIWSRYYQIGTNVPIFGDRDKTIHDDVNEISRERRNGYSWYNNEGVAMLAHFQVWSDDYTPPRPAAH